VSQSLGQSRNSLEQIRDESNIGDLKREIERKKTEESEVSVAEQRNEPDRERQRGEL